VHNWSKLARSTDATSTIVTGGMVSSLASTSPIDPRDHASACSSRFTQCLIYLNLARLAASFRIFTYSLLDGLAFFPQAHRKPYETGWSETDPLLDTDSSQNAPGFRTSHSIMCR